MIPIFNKAYMDKRMYISWRSKIVAAAIDKAAQPTSVLDLGCATGDYAAGLIKRGIRTLGVDSSPAAGQCLPVKNFLFWDLVNPLPVTADLVILLEVLSVVYDSDLILRNAADAAERLLLINRHHHVPDDFVVDEQRTSDLELALRPWAKKQAVKALYNTGVVLRRRK